MTATKAPQFAHLARLEVLFDLSRQAIAKHIRRAQIQPVRREGRKAIYSVRDVAEAIVAHQSEDNRHEGGALADWKARKMELEIELLEIRKREALGELVSASAVRREIARLATATRTQLLNIPETIADALAVETDPEAIETLLDSEIREALEALDEDPITPGETDEDEVDEADE